MKWWRKILTPTRFELCTKLQVFENQFFPLKETLAEVGKESRNSTKFFENYKPNSENFEDFHYFKGRIEKIIAISLTAFEFLSFISRSKNILRSSDFLRLFEPE